jgi:hypothetical protein
MKLLPKSDILIRKAADQKQAVDEGKKLAVSIDRLREVAVQEETSLEKFRSETLSQIHKETSEAAIIRDELLGEVRELQFAKEEALKPLTEELKLINEAREEIAKKAALNVSQALIIDTREQAISVKEKEVSDTLLRTETIEEEARIKMEQILRDKEKTEQLVTEATDMHDKSVILKTTTESSLSEKQKELSSKEEQLTLLAAQLEKERLQITGDRTRLEDREQTLEREFNRLKKK